MPRYRSSPLPEYLVERYHNWKAGAFQSQATHHHMLATEGQTPREMLIACCDSRVQTTEMFLAQAGDVFVQRNVAALVPPVDAPNANNATAASLQYAVQVLKVERLIVMGHSKCGGVRGCYDLCSGAAPELDAEDNFVGRWVRLLRPAYERISQDGGTLEEQLRAMEKEAVLVSLTNVLSYPWIEESVQSGALDLVGLWYDLTTGTLEAWSPEKQAFQPV